MGYIIYPPNPAPPTHTYATWNPADAGTGVTTSPENLAATAPASYRIIRATIGLTAGAWYWEQYASSEIDGVADSLASLDAALGSDVHGWGIFAFNGTLFGTNQNPAWVATPCPNYFASLPARFGFGLDMDAGTLRIWVNGVDRGIAFTGLTGTIYPAAGATPGWNSLVDFGADHLQNPHAGYNTGVYI